MDLSQVPTEDLQFIKDGKWDKVSTPGLQAYQSARQHDAQTAVQAQNPQQIPDAVDKAAQGGKPNAQPISLTMNKQFPSSYNGGGMTATAAQANPSANEGFAKVGTGLALGGVAGAAADALGGGMAANAGANAGASGLQKYLSNLMDKNPDSTQGVVGNAALGGAAGAAISGASNLAQWFGDKAMKSAVGIKDAPGAGTRLANMGIWGTKGQMADQVAQKLPDAENQVQAVIGDIQGSGSGAELRNAVSAKGTKFINPDTGLPFEGKETSYNQVRDLADSMTQEQYSPAALLKLKRASDYEGYTASGNPATSLKAEMEQAQANKAREMLDNMSGGASKEALANEQALLLAKKPLDKANSIPSSLGGLLFQKAPALIGSYIGQAATKAGNVGEDVADPQTLQGLFGLLNASQNKQAQPPQQ